MPIILKKKGYFKVKKGFKYTAILVYLKPSLYFYFIEFYQLSIITCFSLNLKGIFLKKLKRMFFMNILSFIDLIREIFKKGTPDINKIQNKGLLAVKIGQVFALRIDFLGAEKCKELAKLYQDNKNLPQEDFDILLNEYTDISWKKKFAYIDNIPLASASIGQVHKGKLITGEDVVIKLIKKEFTATFKKDVKNVLSLFKLITLFYPKLKRVANPIYLLEMIEQDTLNELKLNNEWEHQDILINIYKNNKDKVDLRDLSFPKIYRNLSNDKLMVSEEIKGETFEKLLQNKELSYHTLKKLFRIHGFYMFGIGTFHGDLHPGNIILSDEKIYFVDCGAIGHVSNKLRVGLFNFMKYLSYYDFTRCAESLHQMSDIILPQRKYNEFHNKFLKLYSNFAGKTVSQVSLTQQMMYTIKLGVNHGMAFERGIFPIIKSLMYLDGMVIRCNPNAVLMEDMREYIPELEPFI